MEFIALYAALDPDRPDPRFAALEPFATRAAISLLTAITGLPLGLVDLPPPALSIRFPAKPIPSDVKLVLGGCPVRYRSWRRAVLDAQLLATGRPVDADPWEALRRIGRLNAIPSVARRLYPPRGLPGLRPADLTPAFVRNIEPSLSRRARADLGPVLKLLRRLETDTVARASGLLPADCGFLEKRTARPPLATLPPRLAARFSFSTPRALRTADAFWTLAVAAGLFAANSDPDLADLTEPGVWNCLLNTDPAMAGMNWSPNNRRSHVARFRGLVIAAGGHVPHRSSVTDDWRNLAAATRRVGKKSGLLSRLAAPAKRLGLGPGDLEPTWIENLVLATPKGWRRQQLRSACRLLDALRTDATIPLHLLPSEPTSQSPVHVTAPGSASKKDRRAIGPIEKAWLDLFKAARSAGVADDQLHPLYAVRAAAMREEIPPIDLDLPWFERLAASDGADRSKVLMSVRLLDLLRNTPTLVGLLPPRPIGMMADLRRAAAPVSPAIEADLRDLLKSQGAGKSTHRAARVALCALAEVASAAGLPCGTLAELLAIDTTKLDWCKHADRADCYRKSLRLLSTHYFLPWTTGWRALQAAVVAAGLEMRDNPVPALLGDAQGREPDALDRAWAQAICRRHRKAGRADLAKTFEARIARLDALRDHPLLAECGLLPRHFGSLRDAA